MFNVDAQKSRLIMIFPTSNKNKIFYQRSIGANQAAVVALPKTKALRLDHHCEGGGGGFYHCDHGGGGGGDRFGGGGDYIDNGGGGDVTQSCCGGADGGGIVDNDFGN